LLEFPLLDSSRLSCPDIEYIIDVMQDDPIYFSLKVNVADQSYSASIETPNRLPCSRLIEYPSIGKDANIGDYIQLVENILSSKLAGRRGFVFELRRLTAVVEFDAIDFSSVSIAVRIKRGNMFTLCIVDFRLTSGFPDAMPLVSLHDLQTSFSTPIENSVFSKVSRDQEPELVARDVLKIVCAQIVGQAFVYK
jgi:hypothetical protein